MEANTAQKMRFVQATCTKCGAALEVDPNQDAAVCPYCDTPYIVEKAINNYNMQHGVFEHVENMNVENMTVDMKGSVDSFFNFASEQMNESRKRREERLRIHEETSRQFHGLFLKIMGVMMGSVLLYGFVMMAIQMIGTM